MLYPPELQARQRAHMNLLVRVLSDNNAASMTLQVEDFHEEMSAARRSYDKFVVCVDKTPEEFLKSLQSLMSKAIDAYEKRAPGLRHGIALDRHVTIMLSESNDARPLCGIYFNLHSPYRKPAVAQKTT